MNPQTLKPIVEALLFASEKPLDASDLLKIIQRVDVAPETPVSPDIEAALSETEDPLELRVADIFSDEFVEETADPLPQETEGELSVSSEKNIADLAPEFDAEEIPSTQLSAEDQLQRMQVKEEEKLGRADIQEVINDLVQEYERNPDRGFVLLKVAQAYQFRTKPDLARYIRAMSKVAPTRLSQAALETLSIIAYRQPITRVEVDQIRGVDSGGVVKSLSDRDLIRIVGKKDEAGRPLLYGTTEGFLEIFNLGSLQDLPSLKELHQIEEEMQRNAAPGNVIHLETEEEEIQEAVQEMDMRFAELEQEEEEAFSELDQEIQLLQSLDEQVKGTLNPKVEVPADIDSQV